MSHWTYVCSVIELKWNARRFLRSYALNDMKLAVEKNHLGVKLCTEVWHLLKNGDRHISFCKTELHKINSCRCSQFWLKIEIWSKVQNQQLKFRFQFWTKIAILTTYKGRYRIPSNTRVLGTGYLCKGIDLRGIW